MDKMPARIYIPHENSMPEYSTEKHQSPDTKFYRGDLVDELIEAANKVIMDSERYEEVGAGSLTILHEAIQAIRGDRSE